MMNSINILSVVALVQITVSGTYDVGLSCRYAEYSLVTYCIGMGGHGVPKWSCNPCQKYFPDVNDNNVTIFKTGFMDNMIHAFVAYEPTKPEIIVAFEGTAPLSITDWIDDLEWTKIDYPLSDCGYTPSCQVHKGFYETYASIRIPLWKTVMQYLDYFGQETPVHITGHSMGSALATHCALDGALTYNRTYDYIYTFGPPRVGDEAFAAFYGKNIKYHYRVTHHRDPVPQLPEQWMQKGYHHVFHEVYYEHNPNETYVICDGSGEDPNCRDKYGTDLVFITNHLDYMGFDFATNAVTCKI